MEIPTIDVQGIPVAAVGLREAIDRIVAAARQQEGGYFTFTGAHGIVEAKSDPGLREALCAATANFADGMPVAWSVGKAGKNRASRVFGPDFMQAMFFTASEHGLPSYLCGGGDGVVEKLAAELSRNHRRTEIVGTHTPPFRTITDDEIRDLATTIEASGARLVWIGLSTPKQEKLMTRLSPHLPDRLLLGVGAAFDIHAGLATPAPPHVQDLGLEWAWRLMREPRRLLPRYARVVPRFLLGALRDALFERDRP